METIPINYNDSNIRVIINLWVNKYSTDVLFYFNLLIIANYTYLE